MLINQHSHLPTNLLLILAAGLVAGVLCRRWNIAPMVGYLVAGALIGPNALGLVSTPEVAPRVEVIDPNDSVSVAQIEAIAQAGVLFLLFSLGIELSLDGLWQLRRAFLIGGAVQTLLVLVPASFVAWLAGVSLGPAILIGMAVANSSTVLAFKALEEWGLVGTPAGRRTLAMLLFGDVALVPFLLFVPFLAGGERAPTGQDLLILLGQSVFMILLVPAARQLVGQIAVERLSRLKSTELLVLFTAVVFGAICLLVYHLGLPPALGALAAGLIFGGTRWSRQIDAVTLPFRETAAAVFFVALGAVMRPALLFEKPVAVISAYIAIVVGKSLAGAVALKSTGLRWKTSFGLGTALGQMSEFSFIVLFTAVQAGVLSRDVYEFLLFAAILTLVTTPQLIRLGLSWVEERIEGGLPWPPTRKRENIREAVVIGAGPIGRSIAAQLETMGMDVCLVDLSPINLYAFAQQGFRTVAGDGQENQVLEHAGVPKAALVVVTVPDDSVAGEIVRKARTMNKEAPILVRCRYQLNQPMLRRAGASAVVSEETEATAALINLLNRLEEL